MENDEENNSTGPQNTTKEEPVEVRDAKFLSDYVEERPVEGLEDADTEQKRNAVIGRTHLRRTSKDIEQEQYIRGGARISTPRWQKKFRWQLRNDRRSRWFCMALSCFVASIIALILLWSLGELIAAIAVAGTITLIGFSVCLVAEVVILCPNAAQNLLYDMGCITPYVEDGGAYIDQSATAGDEVFQALMEEAEELGVSTGRAMESMGVAGTYDVEMHSDGPFLYLDAPGLPTGYTSGGKPIYGDVALTSNTTSAKMRRGLGRMVDAVRNSFRPSMHPDDRADIEYYYAREGEDDDGGGYYYGPYVEEGPPPPTDEEEAELRNLEQQRGESAPPPSGSDRDDDDDDDDKVDTSTQTQTLE